MDELDAINMLLRLIGSSPVNSVSTEHPDAANARATLARIRKRVQRKGWWCNIDYNVPFQPDSAGFIKIPETISSFVASSCYVQRGTKLYDKANNTFSFCSTVIATRVIRVLDWDDMPDVMQEYCAYYAGAEFVRDELEDPQKETSLQRSAATSLLDLKKQELEEGQYNVFSKSRVARMRQGVSPYERGNKRFAGDPDV